MSDLLRHRGPDDEGFMFAGPGGTRCLGGADTPGAAFEVEAAFRPTEHLKSGDAPAGSWLALGHRRLSHS